MAFSQRIELEAYLDAIEHSGDVLPELDERLWNAMVDVVTAQVDGALEFMFKDGQALTRH